MLMSFISRLREHLREHRQEKAAKRHLQEMAILNGTAIFKERREFQQPGWNKTPKRSHQFSAATDDWYEY
jgi:hypothetical protein